MFISLSFGLWYLIHDDELYAQRRIVISDMKKRIKPSSFIFRGSIKQIIVSYAIRFFPVCVLETSSYLLDSTFPERQYG